MHANLVAIAIDEAVKHGLEPALVVAVCLHESAGGEPDAYRPEPGFWRRYMEKKPEWAGKDWRRVSASYGLMQIMYPTAVAHGYKGEPEGLFEPRVNLAYGCLELRKCVRWAKGDVESALAGYNGGRTPDNGPSRAPKRNQAYVDKVMPIVRRCRTGDYRWK